MPIRLYGLEASDRTQEEQKAVDEVMGYEDKKPEMLQIDFSQKDSVTQDSLAEPEVRTTQTMLTDDIARSVAYEQHLNEEYEKALEKQQQKYGTKRNSINTNAEDYIKGIANDVSSYYKKFNGTDKLPLNNQDYKQLSADYDARKQVYGEDNANIWLDNQFKDIVGNNQSWWEQAMYGVSHLIPAIEGGAIQAVGNVWGAVNHILGTEGYNENEDLNPVVSFFNDVIDNPITRYGRDLEHAGASHITDPLAWLGLVEKTADEKIASTKESATEYNPEGIGEDAIVTTSEQDRDLVNSSTIPVALQSGGFTALSMLVGAGEAALANKLFNFAAKGASWASKANVALRTEKGLENALTALKKAQNFTDTFVIPGAVGSMEGAIEGLNTKIEVERDAVNNLDEYYRNKVEEEAVALYNQALEDYDENAFIEVPTDGGGKRMMKMPKPDFNQIYKEVWDQYKDRYVESRRQIDWAASNAGVQNFFANSLINGMMNQTLKAGIMAPRVQETIRNSRALGWAYRRPKFTIDVNNVVSPKTSKVGAVLQVLKEPFGEGLEEYEQSLSNDIFSGAAENNINEFVKNKFEGDGQAKVSDMFGSDWSAALTALTESLTNKESIQSAILGAVSSTLGTVGGIGRGYHRDKSGNLVMNNTFDARNLARGLNEEGQQESWMEYARRVTPWRSGAMNAIFDRKRENAEAQEVAATLTEWIQDPQNKAKWDGLVGTANWISQMENAAESNDQFSYRKSQMGKAINDVFMLSKLKGTDYYDSIVQDLQRVSSMDVESEQTQGMIQQARENGGEEYAGKSDEEIVEKLQSNANKMLGLMTQVEREGKNIDRLLGRIDEDTKQSLIFGKIMEQDFTERRNQLKGEIEQLQKEIENSTGRSGSALTEEQKGLILEYGSLNEALKAQEQLTEQKDKLQQKINELSAIDSDKLSDKQKVELGRSKQQLRFIDAKLEKLDALKGEDGQVDAGLSTLVMNEEEIMSLDPITRAMVLAQGANRTYNATHQNRQKVDQLNQEIDEIDRQIDALNAQKARWTVNGRVKKGHNKQVARNTQKASELQKQKDAKMRELDTEQGKMDSKPIYNSAQQAVIDNLVQQGMAMDADFLDKAVDMGRLEKGIKDYHIQYQAILSDPRAFHNYVQRAKYNVQRDLTRRRAERIAGIQNYQEYAQELDRLTANVSQQEMNEIMQTLKEEDARQKKEAEAARQQKALNNGVNEEDGQLVIDDNGTATIEWKNPETAPQSNYDRYMENMRQQGDMVRQFAKNPELTDNDQSLLLDAMQYLSSIGVEVTDRDAAVQALIEKDEAGNIGGKFRQFVEDKNSMLPDQQKAFMPVFTSIGQVVGQYVDLLNGVKEDAVNRGNVQPTVIPVQPTGGSPTAPAAPAQPTVTSTPSPNSPTPGPTGANEATGQNEVQGVQGVQGSQLKLQEQNEKASQGKPGGTSAAGPSLFTIGGSTPEAGHFVDGDGTVATGTQTQSVQQSQQQPSAVEKPARQQLFEQVTTPEIAKSINDSAGLIENSNVSDTAKELARQFLDQIAVIDNNNFGSIDDIMTAIQEKANELRELYAPTVESSKDFLDAAGLLQKVYDSLHVKKLRGRRTLPMPSSRPENPRAAWIHTANIAFMEKMNPGAWAVTFTNDHAIDEWNRDHIIDRDTPVYFITDSDWTAEVTRQMTPSEEIQSINPNHRKYDTLTDMPVVAAVRVETPANPASTTAIEVGGVWYQPIGVMPSTKAKSSGAEMMEAVRKNASKEQGRHLVTEDGMPNSNPLTTRVFGKNYLTAHHPDASGETNRQNTVENNSEMQDAILRSLPRETEERLRALPKEEMLNDPEYLEARNKVLNGLAWNEESGNNTLDKQLTYTPDNRRDGERGNPMIVFTRPMSETVGRTDNKTLPEVLENGTGEEVRNFNSRTQRLFDEIIRPLFQYLPLKDRNGDKSAKIITQEDLVANPNAYQEEADRLTKLLNGFDGTDATRGLHGVSDFVYVKPGSGWTFKVTAPEALQVAGDMSTSQTVFKVFFINQDSSIAPIELGTIQAGQQDTDAALELMRNIMWDGEQVRDFLNWQVPKGDAMNLNNPERSKSSRARQNFGAIIDDGILSIAGSSIVYDIDGVKLQAPIAADGRIVYPSDTVVNPTNATPAAPQNVTPQGDGAVITNSGQSVEPNSGATLEAAPQKREQQESEKLKNAKETTAKIVADSKEFTLSEDETHYYITDKTTGEQIKYLRVTTVIGADEHAPQWEPSIKDIYQKLQASHSLQDLSDVQLNEFKSIEQMSKDLNIPVEEIRRATAELRTEHKHTKYGAWGVPSTAIGNTVDEIVRDFFAGKFYMIGPAKRGDGSLYYTANSSRSRSEATEHKLEDIYPNISRENIAFFVYQLQLFKADLDSKGIHIVPNGMMAHGKISMTGEDGAVHDVNVAGTLDLFGYDDEGNFYIFDMKTTRDHSDGKLLKEKDKWSRQISMYADLLKQTYGINVDQNNLRIIPIDVDYPTPRGDRNNYLDPLGPVYSVKDDGQLVLTTAAGTEDYRGANPAMRSVEVSGQFQPGYTPFSINWDNLSSEDQDIADALVTQTSDASFEAKPQAAAIETPKPRRASFIAPDAYIDDYIDGTQEATPSAPPVVPNGSQSILPSWGNLTPTQKQILNDVYGIDNFEDYNELLNDPATAEGIKHDLDCRR